MYVFFFKQKTAYEMRISDWSSYVCSSDLHAQTQRLDRGGRRWGEQQYPVELALFAVEPKGGRHRAHRRERFVGGAFADLFLQFRQFGFPVVGRTVEQEVHRELAL